MGVKDVVGTISKIGQINSRDFVAKATGKPFTVWSIGIQIDEATWYNIQNFNKEKCEQVLHCMTLKRPYSIGDRVKMYLESKDNVHWSIVSIVPEMVGGKPIIEEVVEDAEMIEPKVVNEAVIKMEAKVVKLKEAQENKYMFGMACNNAAVIIASKFGQAETANWKVDGWEATYWDLVEQLYAKGVEMRKKLLGGDTDQ